MKNFTLENTDGYTQERLNQLNSEFESFAIKNGFDLSDEQELKSATDKFHNEVMIHG